LAEGKKLFEKKLHLLPWRDRAGDGPLAASLEPAPTNFLDASPHELIKPLFALYNTITLGVDGTSMISYEKNV